MKNSTGGGSKKYILNPPLFDFLEQLIVFEVLKVLIIICKIQPLDILFLVVLC